VCCKDSKSLSLKKATPDHGIPGSCDLQLSSPMKKPTNEAFISLFLINKTSAIRYW
ncbi:hypothetical protein STEG23_018698, partial [Scotinomys teguina]